MGAVCGLTPPCLSSQTRAFPGLPKVDVPIGTKAFLIAHDPKGPTLNHDYYAGSTDPFVAQLISLVERAHVHNILPDLRKGLAAPPNLKKGWYQQAWNEIEYTLARLVNHPKALMLAPLVAKELGRPLSPVKFFERALKLYPQHAITHAQYGKFLMDIGRIQNAIDELSKAIKLDPQLSIGYAWLSMAYQKKGDQALAQTFAEKAKALGYKGRLDLGK